MALEHQNLRWPSSTGCPVVIQSKVGVASAEDSALSGCTDRRAANHDAAAASNSGSCVCDCVALAASGDAGCILVGGRLGLPAPDLVVGTAPANLVIQGRVDVQTVVHQGQAAEGTGPYSYMGCFRDNEGERDMGYRTTVPGAASNYDSNVASRAVVDCAVLCYSNGPYQ